MTVIRVNEQHVDEVAELFDGYRVFYGQASDFEKARTFLQARIQNDESVIFAVASEAGKLVGFTQLYPLFSSVQAQRVWLLNDLFVAPDARRQGVGEMLMETARQFAFETGARGLALETGVDNHNAQALYEKLGYEKQEGTWWYFLQLS